MVLPTLRDRAHVLDFMRGFAVLGILIANISSFAMPDMGGMGGTQVKLHGLDRWLDAVATVLVTGKMRSMLAILFGVGVWLQYEKRSKVEGNWPGGYVKRSAWLGAIGLFHGIFIWFGDILFFYAGMAILTAFLVRISSENLKIIVGIGAGLALLCGAGIAGGISFLSADPSFSASSDFDFDFSKAFVTGTYWDQLKVRLVMYAFVAIFLSLLGTAMLPLFLLGVIFGRSGVLVSPSKHPRTRYAALAIGFGAGIPLNLLGFLKLRGAPEIDIFIEFCGGPILAVGYLMLGAMLVERGALRRLTDALATVGRVALTTYLSQSVLATIVFYSWGLGLFGKLSLAGQLGVVAGIWVFNLIFAHWWVRRFTLGPVEWLLRSLTEGKRMPIRREKDPELAPA
ncbi:MAG: DUF418 domain-containing protein [Fimbriimonas sp.]